MALLFTNTVFAKDIPVDVLDTIKVAVTNVKKQLKNNDEIFFSDFVTVKNEVSINVCGQVHFKDKSSTLFYYDGKNANLLINSNGELEMMKFNQTYDATCKKVQFTDEILTFSRLDL